MEQNPSWEANQFSASQENPRIYGTWRFNTAFTSARHLSLSWASSIQSMSPHPTSWRSISSSHLCLGLPSGLFPSGFPIKTLYTRLFSHMCATCPAYLILDLITWTTLGKEYRSLSSALCRFLHSLVTLIPLRPKYSPQHPILQTPSAYVTSSVWVTKFHTHTKLQLHVCKGLSSKCPHAYHEGIKREQQYNLNHVWSHH